jgi:transcriptional regulator with XRE-family HTH domain
MNQHWTERDTRNFLSRLTFNFVAQLDSKMKSSSMTQAELATKLGVTEGRVSQVLNNESNPTLETIVKYARAMGLKASIVAYEDDDPENYKGLVNAEVFLTCWERQGKPMNFFDLNKKTETSEAVEKEPPIRYVSTNSSPPLLIFGAGSVPNQMEPITMEKMINLNRKLQFSDLKRINIWKNKKDWSWV